GGHLPAREIDRLQARPHHLHGLVAGDGAERRQIGLRMQEVPETVRAALGERIADLERAPEPHHVFRAVGAVDAVETADRRVRDDAGERQLGHDLSSHTAVTMAESECPHCLNFQRLPLECRPWLYSCYC